MRRTAVSLNGVPLNDAHSHGVFFIDLADFLSTTDEIQVQRGVGTNLYGGSAIGGSVNIQSRQPLTEQTTPPRHARRFLRHQPAHLRVRQRAHQRHDGRPPHATPASSPTATATRAGPRCGTTTSRSSGTARRPACASTSSAARRRPTSPTRASPRPISTARSPATSGSIAATTPSTYPNEIDSFFQPHYQVIHSWQINPDLAWQNTFYLFEGDGYFQQFKEDRWMPEYGLEPIELARRLGHRHHRSRPAARGR